MNLNEFFIIVMLMLILKHTTGFSDPASNETRAEVKKTTSISTKIDMEGIQKWTDVGFGLFQVSVSEDSESLMQAIKTLSSAIPYLGPILSGLLDLIPGSDKFEEIKNQLHQMDSHLFAIENKIDALSKQVTDTAILSYYKSQAEKINVIEMSYKRYIIKNTNINMHELISNCKRHNILDYVYYVHRELRDSSGILSLMTVMKDNCNLANFQIWMKMLAASISQCMMLHTICMFAQYKNQTDLNDTMDGDILFFENMADLILKVVIEGTTDIKRNFFEMAKLEIFGYASSNLGDDHTKFAREVWQMLVNKYFWRHWFVASYDDEQYGSDKHYVTFKSQYVYAWFRLHNRNVNVVHTNNNDSSIGGKLKTILDSRKWNINVDERCRYVFNYIANRIGNKNSLGVVSFESDFSAKWSTGIAAVYFIESINHGYKEGFNVFAVAGEI